MKVDLENQTVKMDWKAVAQFEKFANCKIGRGNLTFWFEGDTLKTHYTPFWVGETITETLVSKACKAYREALENRARILMQD